MAEPDISPSRLVAALHNATIGQTRDGWRTDTRTRVNPGDANVLFDVELTNTRGGARPYRALYRPQADGSPGRIVEVVGADGVAWRKGRGDVWRQITERPAQIRPR